VGQFDFHRLKQTKKFAGLSGSVKQLWGTPSIRPHAFGRFSPLKRDASEPNGTVGWPFARQGFQSISIFIFAQVLTYVLRDALGWLANCIRLCETDSCRSVSCGSSKGNPRIQSGFVRGATSNSPLIFLKPTKRNGRSVPFFHATSASLQA
jgi:hypothetical protein